jgi:hypothetical protein
MAGGKKKGARRTVSARLAGPSLAYFERVRAYLCQRTGLDDSISVTTVLEEALRLAFEFIENREKPNQGHIAVPQQSVLLAV